MGHNLGANHDSGSTDFIMYPFNGSNERFFSPQTIAAFDNTLNDQCLDVVGTGPTTEPPPTTTPPPPTGDCVVEIVVNSDNYPEETSWSLVVDSTGEVLAEQDINTVTVDGTTINKSVGVDAGVAHTFTIADSEGDGICCGFGNGSFSVSVDGQVILSGSDFGSESSTSFALDNSCNVAPPSTTTQATPTTQATTTSSEYNSLHTSFGLRMIII